MGARVGKSVAGKRGGVEEKLREGRFSQWERGEGVPGRAARGGCPGNDKTRRGHVTWGQESQSERAERRAGSPGNANGSVT